MTVEVESVLLTSEGNLRLSAELAQKYFPASVCVATLVDEELVLLPLRSAANGGLVLKQRNTAGDRAVLLSEVLRFHPPAGRFPVSWHADRGALVVALGAPLAEGASSGEPDVAYGGRGGLPAVGGLSAGDELGGRGAASTVGAPERVRSPVDGVAGATRRPPSGSTASAGGSGGAAGRVDRQREAT